MRNLILLILGVIGLLCGIFFGLISWVDSEYKADELKSCEELEKVILGTSDDNVISNYAKIQALYEVKCK